jgi:hypothetical protein
LLLYFSELTMLHFDDFCGHSKTLVMHWAVLGIQLFHK